MRLPWKKRRRVWVNTVHEVDGKTTYDLVPQTYDGPHSLKPGTVLEVVSVPKDKGAGSDG